MFFTSPSSINFAELLRRYQIYYYFFLPLGYCCYFPLTFAYIRVDFLDKLYTNNFFFFLVLLLIFFNCRILFIERNVFLLLPDLSVVSFGYYIMMFFSFFPTVMSRLSSGDRCGLASLSVEGGIVDANCPACRM